MSCLADISAKFAGELDNKDIRKIAGEVADILDKTKKLMEEGKLNDPQAFIKESFKRLEIQREFLAKERVKRLKNVEAREYLWKRVESDGATRESIESLLYHDAKIDKINIEGVRDSYKKIYQNAFDYELEKGGVRDAFMTGDLDEEIINDVFALSSKDAKHISKDPMVMKVAEGIKRLNNVILKDKQAKGYDVKGLQNYIVPFVWDAARLMKVNFDDFVSDIMKNSNMERLLEKFDMTEKDLGTKEWAKIMQDIYMHIKSKDDLLVEDDLGDLIVNILGEKKAHKFERSRVFEWKDGPSFSYMLKKYSTSNLYDATQRHINGTARTLALAEVLGPSPKTNLSALITRAKNKAVLDENVKVANELANIDRIEKLYQIASGTLPQVENFISKGVRAAQMATNLIRMGSASVTALTTDPVFASISRSAYHDTGLLRSYFAVVGKQISVLNPSERKRVSQMFNTMTQDFTMNLIQERYDITTMPTKVGWTQRVYDKVMKSYMIREQILLARTGAALDIGVTLAEELSVGAHRNVLNRLSNYKIDGTHLDILKASMSDYKGSKVIAPEMIRSMPVEMIKKIVGTKTTTKNVVSVTGKVESVAKEVDDSFYEGLRETTADRYAAFVGDATKVYSPTPNAYIRYITGGEISNPSTRALISLMTQYKSFGLAALRTWRFANAKMGDKSRISKFMAMSQGLMMLTMMKYAAQSTVDLLSGELPDDITNPQVLGKNMLNSGAGGLAADMLFTEFDKYGKSFSSYAMGPIAGQMPDDVRPLITKLYKGIFTGEEPLTGEDVVKKLVKYTPNPWYLRGLLNKTVTDNIRTAIEPRYETNKRQRFEDSSGLLWQKGEILE